MDIPYSELTAEQKLRACWADFCSCDLTEPDFADEMESAGFIQLLPVDDDALQQPFADELGIEAGGMMWALTDAGRAVYRPTGEEQAAAESEGEQP